MVVFDQEKIVLTVKRISDISLLNKTITVKLSATTSEGLTMSMQINITYKNPELQFAFKSSTEGE